MTPRPAATLVVVRQGSHGLEVLMLERPTGGFFGGLWVFPGGAVEPVDDSELARRAVLVPNGAEDGAWRSAALRETAEELGLTMTSPPLQPLEWGHGSRVFEQVLRHGAAFDGGRLRPLSRWVTPEWAPTRYDTRFYLAVVEEDPPLRPRVGEVERFEWVTPSDALARADRSEWALVTPTLHHLTWLASLADVSAAWHLAGGARRLLPADGPADDGSLVLMGLPAMERG